jgi:predicted esterase
MSSRPVFIPARRLTVLAACYMLSVLAGCASVPTPAEREASARDQAAHAGLVWTSLPTARPMVAALPALTHAAPHLVVYIEGDGLAWRTADWPSDDPTPTHPLALHLARVHPSDTPRAWLARPCQYVDAAHTGCPVALWTSARQGSEALRLSHQALDEIKRRLGARTLTLVGHSGGGTLAALLMSERADVTHLVTVAANIDLAHWVALHRLSPQRDSFDPADRTGALQGRSQRHLAGGRDQVVPPSVAQAFANRFPAGLRPAVEVLPLAEHEAGWQALWKAQGAQWLQPLQRP